MNKLVIIGLIIVGGFFVWEYFRTQREGMLKDKRKHKAVGDLLKRLHSVKNPDETKNNKKQQKNRRVLSKKNNDPLNINISVDDSGIITKKSKTSLQGFSIFS